MIEIKFKAKRVDTMEWVFGQFVKCNGSSYIVNLSFVNTIVCNPIAAGVSYEMYEVYEETVQQFTSQKDKNGKDIYDGDIIMNANGDKSIIDYSISSASFTTRSFYGGGRDWFYQNNEVIGNVHENIQIVNS